MSPATKLRRRALAFGFRGLIPTRLGGYVTRWISAKFPTRIFATKTFVPGIYARASTFCCTDTLISNWLSRSRVYRRSGRPCLSKRPLRHRVSVLPLNPMILREESATKDSSRSNISLKMGGLMVTLGSGTMLALEGGLVRFVRRSSGGVPRSTAGGGPASAAASQQAATRTPGAHVRVTFYRANHPIAYGYPVHTYVFRQNFPLYDIPRHWLRMAYCTTCLDGPEDRSAMVMEWGDTNGGTVRRKRPGMGRRKT